MPQHDKYIAESHDDGNIIRTRFEKFEKTVFEKKLSETSNLIKDTDKLIEKIENQAQRIEEDLVRVKKEIENFVPQNQEQRLKLNQIQNILYDADAKLERADSLLDSDLRDKEILEEGHQTCM